MDTRKLHLIPSEGCDRLSRAARGLGLTEGPRNDASKFRAPSSVARSIGV